MRLMSNNSGSDLVWRCQFVGTQFVGTLMLAAASLALVDSTACAQQATQAAQKKSVPDKRAWKPLFDGKSLKDWKITNFGGEGEVVVENGIIKMGMGSSLTGITYIKKVPKCDYELLVEAMRIDGIDFFSTVTFPVNNSFCSLVVGGWAGPVVGISCVDLADASENETTTYQKFEREKWYRIRIQVRQERIRAWIDDKQVVDLVTKGHKLSPRAEVLLNRPLGIASWETLAGIRKIALRELDPEPEKSP